MAAQCKQGKDEWDTSQNGCIECTADKRRCQRCAVRWVLTPEGQCARVRVARGALHTSRPTPASHSRSAATTYVQCNATHIGGWNDACVSCRPDNPKFCLKVCLELLSAVSFNLHQTSTMLSSLALYGPLVLQCDKFCTSRSCDGYFVTREGHCSRCPEGAAACSDLTGEVRECNSYLGLVGGECRPCKVEECLKCDGEWLQQMPVPPAIHCA